jgi:hypothetical protein
MIPLVLLAYVIVSAIEINALIKKKYWRDLTVFSFFMGFSFVISMLTCFGVKLPNPLNVIHYMLEWLGLHY